MNYKRVNELDEIHGIDYESDECIIHDHVILDCREFVYIEYELRHYVFRLYNINDIDLFTQGEQKSIDAIQYAQNEYELTVK